MKNEDSQIKFTYNAYRDMQRAVYCMKNYDMESSSSFVNDGM